MCIEFARNVLNISDATSYEFREVVKSKHYVIHDMPGIASLEILGNT